MAKLSEHFKSKRFRLGVKQHALVLDFTTAIQDAMNALSITQSDLAKRLGKSRAWVCKIFRRTPNLTFFTAVEVANALDMDVELSVTLRAQSAVGTGFVAGSDLASASGLVAASSFVTGALFGGAGLVVNSLAEPAMHTIVTSAEVSAGTVAVAPSQSAAANDPQKLAA